MVFSWSAGDSRGPGIHFYRRRIGDASMELAAAAVVWMGPNYLLAGSRIDDSVPYFVRRPWCFSLEWFQYAAPNQGANARTMGAHDARRTRKGPPTLGTLRPIRAARCQADNVSAARLARAQARIARTEMANGIEIFDPGLSYRFLGRSALHSRLR